MNRKIYRKKQTNYPAHFKAEKVSFSISQPKQGYIDCAMLIFFSLHSPLRQEKNLEIVHIKGFPYYNLFLSFQQVSVF